MQKTTTKITTALLLTAMTLAVLAIPLVNASTGFIQILTTPPIIPAGGTISLDLTTVLWSGGQFYLLLSLDGYSQVSPADLRYTPSFTVAQLKATTNTVVANDPSYPGSWTIGNNIITGPIPTNIAGGLYSIKAFDGAVTSLAVTENPFTVTASISVTPTSGGAGRSLTIKGNAFPANALVNITYLNPVTATYVTVNNLTQTGAIGNFTYTLNAPDIINPATSVPGDVAVGTNTIQFQVTENKTSAVYTANYVESQRGLSQIGRPQATGVVGNIQNATVGLYGNLTDFSVLGPVSVGVGDSLRIAGSWFYPGAMTIMWDNSVNVTPANLTASATGSFNTTITVPTTGLGRHNITIDDASTNVVFAVYVNVVQSITISPTSGPIGTTVTITGYGFPAAGQPAGYAYNITLAFAGSAQNYTLTDANGQFTATIVVPTAVGGANPIRATANDTAGTFAEKTFNVVAAFSVSPSSFYANSSNTAVKASGTGFSASSRFYVAIDNVFSPFSDTVNGIAPSGSGSISFTFIGVGFQPGLHVVSLYQVGGNNAPVANTTFTVLSSVDVAANALLTSINQTVTNIAAMIPTITSISNGVATLNTNVGTITTSLSSIGGQLTSVAGTVGTISTNFGSITSDLSSIGTRVTSISDGVATIQTDVGTIKGTVTSTDGKVATIQTDIGTLTTDVSSLQTSVDNVPGQVTTPIWIAVVLALIAAIAAIASLIMMRRKIAG